MRSRGSRKQPTNERDRLVQQVLCPPLPELFKDPSFLAGLAVLALLGFVMVKVPLANAGSPDEPAPPTAIM